MDACSVFPAWVARELASLECAASSSIKLKSQASLLRDTEIQLDNSGTTFGCHLLKRAFAIGYFL